MENRLDLILEAVEKVAEKLEIIEEKQELYYQKLDLELTFIKKILLVMDDNRTQQSQLIIERLNKLENAK
jgi:hypothetical protein